MSELSIDVEKRTETGTNANRRLRQSGKIPAVVYGGGKDTVPIQLDRKTLLDMMKSGQNENAIFLLKLADSGQERHAMIHDMQINPLTRQVIHIDFQRIVMDQKVRIQVPVELVGTAFGVKTEGGMIDFVHREVALECLPGDIPQHIELDVTDLHVGQHVEAKDLKLPAGVTLAEEPDRVIVALSHTKAEESAVAGEAVAEPEVVAKRGKTEEGA
ncbi:MAG: large subunit ribosomal protein [Acidobacteriota bacterium]|jgi:large subunit ribosomal protein L25|nr:large subunit ribosomal protein [Acidobacteriota bacterium]